MSNATQAVYFEEAIRLFKDHNFEECYDILERITEKDPSHIEAQSYLSLAKNHLLKGYNERFGQEHCRVRIVKNPQELVKFNLTNEAGYVLSLLAGHTELEDVIALSSLNLFNLFRILHRLERLGIVEVDRSG